MAWYNQRISIPYKGFALYYDEDENSWSVPAVDVSMPSLKELKGYIDNAYISTPLRVIFLGRGSSKSEAQSGRISRVNIKDRFNPTDMVFHYPSGGNRRVKANELILDTPENRATLAEIQRLDKEADELRYKSGDMLTKMRNEASPLVQSAFDETKK